MKSKHSCYAQRIRLLSAFCICLFLFVMMVPAVANAADSEIQTVRVGYLLTEDFQEEEVTQQNGQEVIVRSGYGHEYLQMIRYYAGWNYEYVHGTWEELIEMLQSGEIDLLGYVGRTEEREQTMLFSTEPQGRQNHYLYVDGPSEAIDPNDYKTLHGKTIGTLEGDFRTDLFLDWCQEQGIMCYIREFTDMESVHTAFHSGEIHAVSASSLGIAAYPEGKWKPVIRFDDVPVYFAAKAGPEGQKIMDRVNEAMSQLLDSNENFSQELQRKYVSAAAADTELTLKERQMIRERGVLNVGYCEYRRPLSYSDDNGELSGLLAEYLNAMTEAYRIQFNLKPYPDGISMLTALQNREVDMIAPVGYSHGMAEAYDMAVTAPLTVETMVAVYKGYDGTEPKDFFRQMAILDSSITEKDYAQRFYPESQWVIADSVEEAIRFVVEDQAECYIIRSSTWSWYKNEYPQINDLQVLTLPDTNEVNMALRNEDVGLIPILNKGISLLTPVDVNQIIVAHTDPTADMTWWTIMQRNPEATLLGVLTIVLFVVLISVVYRLQTDTRYMKKLEAANKKAEWARQEAERANEAKSTFLTSMSHDIRTPMNAIVGMTTLAAKHIHDPDYVRNCLSKVTLASDHLLTLINDVLDINKIESGNLSLTPKVFSLADSIVNLANIGRHQLQEKNHQFEIRVHHIQHEYLFADELRINQVFINLLSNAVKYTPDGGHITIDVKQQPVPGKHSKVRVIFVIKDTGIGMSEDFQEHMYDLFAMANKAGRSVSGSGVGLAICKQLINLMDGTIDCVSQEGKGTKFTVTLDLEIADRVGEQLMLPPMKILLVDDDEVFLETAADTLKDLGLSPDCVDSGEKAIATVARKHREGRDYPLIIIDWMMPEMDGGETTRGIRNLLGPDVSIIVISAYSSEEIRDQAIAAGANGFINKPLFRSHAYSSITEVLGLQEQREEVMPDTHQKVNGMHLLIAEDNDLNWEIIRELLAMYGVKADRAEDGRMCLDMLKQTKAGTYDAVLMDIQMPNMNGYDASIAIRQLENRELSMIPIIAMTANAYTEDVMRCAESGMNAHIPKPIDMQRLLTVLGDLKDH